MSIVDLSPVEVVRRNELLSLSCAQYADMIESGIIPEGTACELLEGILVTKDRSSVGDPFMGHSPRHRLAVRRLIALAARIDSPPRTPDHPGRHLQVQLPIELGEGSTPEPDAAVILGSDSLYIDRLPGPADVLAVIEVAESSLERDRKIKSRVYARAGIPQYVLINLAQSQIEVFTDPVAGTYTNVTILRTDNNLALRIGPDETLTMPASDLLN